MMASIWVCQAAAGATAFILTDAFLPVWNWRGIDLAATFLNMSGYDASIEHYFCTLVHTHLNA